ncbi:MAG TPA: hypothetical protein VGN17_04875 [Bryobacteraceae bacterium]
MLPDVFKRLKPLYGKRIDDLWIAYNVGTPEDKIAIDEVLTILAVRRLGIAVGDEKITLEPPTASVIGGGEYTLGTVNYPGLPPYPFTLYRRELLRHLFLLGPSGTGKSTLILGLLRQLLRDGLDFWSVDFKRNYRCLLGDPHARRLVVLTVGRGTAPLRLNMLQAPHGVEPAEWAEALTDIISTAYLLMQGARNVLKESLLNAITTHGARGTLRDALDHLRLQLGTSRGGSRRYGWLESSYRSIEELTKGALGNALNAPGEMTLGDLLDVPVVFELQGLGEDQKRCFCLYLLQAVLLLRKHQSDQREVLRHVLVFDEAHNVFPKEQWGQLGVPSKLAREVREYGEALIAATQQADVADSLIANSGTKLILRTDYPKDVDFASKLLQVDARWLAKIPLGQGIARLPTRYYQPFLFNFPEQPLKNQIVTDERVQVRYAQWTRTEHAMPPVVIPTQKEVSEGLRPREHELLLDVAAHPISAVTERYARLGWNPKTGNGIKDAVLQAGLVEFVVIDAGRTRVKLLTLTSAGERLVVDNGGTIQRSGRAGMEHEFWRARLKERCEARGYTVTEEYHLGNGKRVDLRAVRDGRMYLIEIETGKSDVKANVEKCAGHGALVVFFSSAAARDAAVDAIPATCTVITPETLNMLHRLLL